MSVWAKDKKLAWQRRSRRKRALLGFCINHYGVSVVSKTRCQSCVEQLRKHAAQKRRQLKSDTIREYGSVCSCCKESRLEFLTLEHSFPSQLKRKERRKLYGTGVVFYAKLKKLGYPKDQGLLVHCFNCNSAKGAFGYCPHERERDGK